VRKKWKEKEQKVEDGGQEARNTIQTIGKLETKLKRF
jgi:hypothetical protein